MEAIIVSYRRGKRLQNTKQLILHVDSIDSKEKAEKIVGKQVSWHAPGKNKKVLSGKVTAPHGRKGAVRALFETGIPGQALGQIAKIE